MEKIARYEDYMLFMQLYAAGLQGANLQECLYQYYFDSKNSPDSGAGTLG